MGLLLTPIAISYRVYSEFSLSIEGSILLLVCLFSLVVIVDCLRRIRLINRTIKECPFDRPDPYATKDWLAESIKRAWRQFQSVSGRDTKSSDTQDSEQ